MHLYSVCVSVIIRRAGTRNSIQGTRQEHSQEHSGVRTGCSTINTILRIQWAMQKQETKNKDRKRTGDYE